MRLTGCPVVGVIRGHAQLRNLEPGGGGADSRGGVIDLGHVDLQYGLERLFDDSIRHAGTHVNGTVVVSANGLVGACPVVGLLVHLDGDRVARLSQVSVQVSTKI